MQVTAPENRGSEAKLTQYHCKANHPMINAI